MVSTYPDLRFQLVKAGAQRDGEGVHKNEMGVDWTGDYVDSWVFVDNPLITIVRLQDEESGNLEDEDVDVDDVLVDMEVEGDYGTEAQTSRTVMIILLFSTAAPTSALSPTLARENGRCLRQTISGRKRTMDTTFQ